LALADLTRGRVEQVQEVSGVKFRFRLRMNKKTMQPIFSFGHEDDFADSSGSSTLDEKDITSMFGSLSPDDLRKLLVQKVDGYLRGERPGKIQSRQKRMDSEHRSGLFREHQINAHKSAILAGREPEPSPVLEIQARTRDKVLREQSREIHNYLEASNTLNIA